jgi:hypothetical protein
MAFLVLRMPFAAGKAGYRLLKKFESVTTALAGVFAVSA